MVLLDNRVLIGYKLAGSLERLCLVKSLRTRPSMYFCNHVIICPFRLIKYQDIIRWLAVQLSGDASVSINVVTLRWARLVPGWVTFFGRVNYLGM